MLFRSLHCSLPLLPTPSIAHFLYCPLPLFTTPSIAHSLYCPLPLFPTPSIAHFLYCPLPLLPTPSIAHSLYCPLPLLPTSLGFYCQNMRDIESVKIEKFKFELNKFLELIHDEPKLPNYVTASGSNCILYLLTHLRAQGIYQSGGVPDSAMEQS